MIDRVNDFYEEFNVEIWIVGIDRGNVRYHHPHFLYTVFRSLEWVA